MNCPTCKIGLIIWVPANPPAPGHYRCHYEMCRRVFKNETIKKLRKQEEAEKNERREQMETTEQKLEKKCSGKCKKVLPATEEYFHKSKLGKYGLNSCCKACKSEQAKDRWEAKKKRRAKRNGNGIGARKSRVALRTPDGTEQSVKAIPHAISLPIDAIVAIERAMAKKVIQVIAEHFGV